jgi:hypothetical protein
MTQGKTHLIRDRGAAGDSAGAHCGFMGVRVEDGTWRRLGGFRIHLTDRPEDVTCATCIRKAEERA